MMPYICVGLVGKRLNDKRCISKTALYNGWELFVPFKKKQNESDSCACFRQMCPLSQLPNAKTIKL